MNLPNVITVGRLVVTIACIALLAWAGKTPSPQPVWWAFALFLFAAVTDFFDGWLARRWHQVTQFGRIADPFADKILICGTMIMLVGFPATAAILPGWVVVVVVARELLVTTLRAAAESAGHAFPADRLGKWKMIAQCVAASALLTVLAGTDLFTEVAIVAVWLSLALTVLSGINYVAKATRLLQGS
ncbi:MAG TPA: CDP-diacylglycerol--glycerol-3-phosphate 3-phosphatidyltransferase [Planctomycetota bacterium]|nr:CDP-diacylglycerol--glycerol-3-phosphate 3-phosphatidyltransferase [Planctomycetota bacterium]